MILPLSVVKQADLSRTWSIILEVCFLAFETKLRLLCCRENLDLKNLDDVRVAILQYKKKITVTMMTLMRPEILFHIISNSW